MRTGLRNIILGTAAVGLALVGANPALAGQAGSITYTGTSTTVSGPSSASISSAGTISVSVGTSTTTVGAGSVDSSKVTLSLQISDDGYHGYSPSRNVATFSGALTNSATIGSGNGITSSQQTIGNANVSVHSNSLLDANALTTILSNSVSAAGGATAVMVLNPAFAISNSALAARVLAVEAMSGRGGAFGATTAIDIVGKNTFEMSPENNIATFLGNATNNVAITNGNGITQSQQQIGNGNVQAGFNTIVFTNSGTGTLPGFH